MNPRILIILLALGLAGGCAGPAEPASAAASAVEAPATVVVAGGPFVAGSDRAEREQAYRLDQAAYGHDVTRRQRWYEGERARAEIDLPTFRIMTTPVTNGQYQQFVTATGHPAPDVTAATWASYRLVHPFARTRRHAWAGGAPPPGRADHPVVLIGHDDAVAYAAWLSEVTGRTWRLPTALEWEKAARGSDGRRFPWGDDWDPRRLNSHDLGPFDTMAVGSFPDGASPFGLVDAAGQVFEWTATAAGPERFLVKGGSWDDQGCGVCRPAAGHGRPATLRHILIGFRLVELPISSKPTADP
jgi:formylglycine-generating enzyme required for sulfatase activity